MPSLARDAATADDRFAIVSGTSRRSPELPEVAMASTSRADEQLASLAQFNASHGRSNIIGIHVFSFGGFQATARWMNEHLNLAKD